uniref:Uncharacterized protein LOC111106812 isoform X2 n=1 Tax=Crassostrea virginica TaxID=6565 RepID=A0A8B8B3W4_CRAVI|nr:uncharacterized protein LOC111106812 isoform X2 [Crassostrea virginica]
MDKLTDLSKICESEARDSCYDSENNDETTCSSSAEVQQAPLRRSKVKRFQARVSCDGINEAQQIFCAFKKAHTLDGWLGYEGDELVIVAFSKKKIPNFPTIFQTLRIVLRTGDDNDKRIDGVPRLIKDDVKTCKEIIEKYGPRLMDKHSNISMITPSSYRLQNGVPIANVCIAIYCRGKCVIPLNEEPFPTSLECVKIDVREGYCAFGMKNEELLESGEYHQNLRIGVQIGVSGGPIGTLGGFLHKSGKTFFLTCAHVVIPHQCLLHHNPEYKYPANRCYTCEDIDVYQPAMDRISMGKVAHAIFQHSRPGITSIDAAIIYITDDTRIPTDPYMTKQPSNTNQLRAAGFSMNNPPHFSTGKIMPQMDEPSKGHMVVKCGSVTGLTHGLLALDGGIFRLENRELRLPGQLSQERIIMYRQYLVESINNLQFFDLGDSGSLVFMHDDDKSLKCIGMAVGMTTHGGCIVTPIEAILKAFGIHDDDSGPPFLPFNDGDDDYGDDDSDETRFDEKGRDNPKKRSRQPDNYHSRMDHSGLDINSEHRQREQPCYVHNVTSDDSQVTGVNVDPTVTVRDTSLEICVTGNQHLLYNHFESNTGKKTLVVPTSEIRSAASFNLFDYFQTEKKPRKSQEMLHKTVILYGFIYFCLAVFKTTFGSEEEIISSQLLDRFVRNMSVDSKLKD